MILFVSIIQERSGRKIRDMLMEKKLRVQWACIFVGIFAVIIFGFYGPGMDPAEFVYMQF